MANGRRAWLLGRTPAQRKRLDEMLRRPIRSAVIQGLLFGAAMSVVYFVAGAGAVAAAGRGVVSALIFGPMFVGSLWLWHGD